MRLFIVLLVWCVAGPLSIASNLAAATRSVVLLFDERPELPGLTAFEADLVRTLAENSSDKIEIYREAMDLSRFGSNEYKAVLRDFLRTKFADKKIDVAVAIQGPAIDFLLDHGAVIFPGAPLILSGIDKSEFGDRSLPSHARGIVVKREFSPTLELALKLHPGTERIVVVSGSSEFDMRLLEQARREFRIYEDRLAFTYLTELPLHQVVAEVSQLPSQSIVLFVTFFRDGAGEPFVPHDVVPRISAAASVPTYGFVDQYLGRGIVGGSLYSFAAQGNEAAKLILKILNDPEQSGPALQEPQTTKVLFDWRQMQRWSISESSLPPGSEIRFRDLTLWDQYRIHILTILAALVFQSGLISWLIYEHRRRQTAEADSLHLANDMARVNRLATAGQLSASIAHEIRQPLAAIASSGSAGMNWLKKKVPDLEEAQAAFDAIIKQVHRADDVIKGVRAMFSHEPIARTTVNLNELVRQVLALTTRTINSNNITLDTKLADNPPPLVEADPVQLQQVLLNLVMNAIEAMVSSDHWVSILRIETGAEQTGTVWLAVVDSGPGFDTKVAKNPFAPFVTTKAQGMGVGLSICKSIIEQHGGQLTATSNTPRGARLKIVLPRASGI